MLAVKLGGSLSLESSLVGGSPLANLGGPPPDVLVINSLSDFQNLLSYASHDPRVSSLFIQIEGFQCGYAKLEEVKRSIKYFQESGKEVVAYAAAGAEKELFVALECDSFFVPPDGGLDLRGFSGAATFVRGVFDKLGISFTQLYSIFLTTNIISNVEFTSITNCVLFSFCYRNLCVFMNPTSSNDNHIRY